MGKQIESAQKRMEGSNFDTRKNVKKYDDVLNAQRDVVYENRNKILQYFADAKELLKDDQYKDADLESIKLRDFVLRRIVKETEVIVDEFIVSNKIPRVNTRKILEAVSEIVPERLFKKVLEKGLKTTEETFIELLQKNDKPEHYKEQLREIVEHAYEEQEEEIGFGLMREIEKQVSLDAYDYNWMSHLETMEDLNHSVNMRSYGQRDPLVEYKNEGFNIFVSMMMNIDSSIARRILKLSIAPGDLLYEQTPGESENNTAKIKGSGAPVDPKQFISTREVLTSSKESKQSKKKQRKEEQRRKQQEAVMSRMPKKFKNK